MKHSLFIYLVVGLLFACTSEGALDSTTSSETATSSAKKNSSSSKTTATKSITTNDIEEQASLDKDGEQTVLIDGQKFILTIKDGKVIEIVDSSGETIKQPTSEEPSSSSITKPSEFSSSSEKESSTTPRTFIRLAFTDETSFDRVENFQWKSLSHLALFAWNMESDGSIDKGNFSNTVVKKYVAEAKKYNVKILVTIGGAGRSAGFPSLAASQSKSQTFADNLLKEAKDLGLAGFDFDWEFPRTSAEKEDYLDLIKIMHETFKGEDLSISVDSDAQGAPFNNNDYLNYVTWVNVMAYDQSRFQSSRSVTEDEWNIWDKDNVPHNMMVWGVPFYARNGALTKPYSEISEEVKLSDDVYNEYYYFNGVETVKWKTEHLYKNDYKGIMAWQLRFDETWDENKSLLLAIDSQLSNLGAKK